MKKLTVLLVFVSLIPLHVSAYNDTSKSSIVMDMGSGRILYQKNPDKKMLIASTTKIMTAIIALEHGNLNKKVKVGEEVLKMYGTNIYIEVGEKIKLKDLIYGLLLRSGNDASVVIAKEIAGDETKFVRLMNKKAKELGMTNTIFKNPHGLDENNKNYSTAKDMAILSQYAYKNKIYRKISSTKKYEVSTGKKTYLWYNRNKLLMNYKPCTGGKNGYTPSAGKTLVTTANKNNLNLTIVSLDDSNSYNNHENLYKQMFSKYNNYEIISKYDFKIDKNFYNRNIYIKKSFYYPLETKEVNNIKTIVSIDSSSSSKRVGIIKVYLKDKNIKNITIYQKKER